jgi:hypothetical protein
MPEYFDFARFNFHVPTNGSSCASNAPETARDMTAAVVNARIRFIVSLPSDKRDEMK